MTPQPTEETWRCQVTLAVITGIVSGAARTLITWALDHLASHL
jgi:hypothetical protein